MLNYRKVIHIIPIPFLFSLIDRYKDKIFFSDEIDYRMYLDHKRISWIYLDIIDKSLASVKTTTSAKKSEAPSGAAASNGAEKYDEILRNFASLTDLFKSIDPNLRTNAAKKQISISEEIPITDSPRFVATNIPEHFRKFITFECSIIYIGEINLSTSQPNVYTIEHNLE